MIWLKISRNSRMVIVFERFLKACGKFRKLAVVN
jgi:hypothetical protein